VGEHSAATYLRETADLWNANIERWTYASGGELAQSLAIEGYYVRIAPLEDDGGLPMRSRVLRLKNREASVADEPAGAIVSPDALALVRFGLRRADDPRILSTITAIDAVLKTQTATGPVWHRYVEDGYGEHADGSPFNGTGIGRGWPLLAGERGHYELAAGNRAAAERLLETMARQTSEGGLLPEQVWDAADIPEQELFNGKPAGSAMPLAWAHAEYLKLARSLEAEFVVDTPPQVVQRYVIDQVMSHFSSWRFNNKCRSIPAGTCLRVETLAPAEVVWTADAWATVNALDTMNPGLGVHVADLPTEALLPAAAVEFTFRWRESGTWEGNNFRVVIAPSA
jgi:glucoamylase